MAADPDKEEGCGHKWNQTVNGVKDGQTDERQRPVQQQGQMENRIQNVRDIKAHLFRQTWISQTDCDSHRRDRFSPNHSESVSPSHFFP